MNFSEILIDIKTKEDAQNFVESIDNFLTLVYRAENLNSKLEKCFSYNLYKKILIFLSTSYSVGGKL